MQIKVKYFTDGVDKIEKIPQGDWIDLRCAEDTKIHHMERAMIPLGIGMILPDGYEAIVAPRSSTIKLGVMMANSIGIIDNSYSGENDQWHFPAVCVCEPKDGWAGYDINISGTPVPFVVIKKNTRICQFRIQKIQPVVEIIEVEHLNEVSRGGLGSTGTEDFKLESASPKYVEYTFKDGSKTSETMLRDAVRQNIVSFPGKEKELDKLADKIILGWLKPENMTKLNEFVAMCMKQIGE